jgi:hypothetical protein
MFTNPFFSKFFDLGQVINTERGGGVFQPAVDQAVKLLQDGEWVSQVTLQLTQTAAKAHVRSTSSQKAKSISGTATLKAV